MTVREALAFFSTSPKVLRRLQVLDEIGLGYLRLGQPATTLSGGEAQRIKIAAHLASFGGERVLYILDEPTTGLHFDDIAKLLAAFRKLVEAGHTLLVIEHNLDVIKTADYVIDLGPEGGEGGGEVVATGTPEQVAQVEASHTGPRAAAGAGDGPLECLCALDRKASGRSATVAASPGSDVLPRSFYERPDADRRRGSARQGARASHAGGRTRPGMIVEAEAYIGEDDPACHAAPGPTTRNAPLYGPPGVAYVYLNYGMHYLVNAVTEAKGIPAAVLIRALAAARRHRADDEAPRGRRRRASRRRSEADLCRGPGNLTKALGITLSENRLDLTSSRLVDRGPRPDRGPACVGTAHRHPRRRRAAVAVLGRRASVGVGPREPVARGRLQAARAPRIRIETHMGKTLLQKVWDLHTVRQLPTGQTQLFIGLHLVHEVTTPQAFDELRARGWKVARPDRTFATVDHIIPTRERAAAVSRRDGRGHDRVARAQLPRLRHPLRRPGRRPPGHRARDRSRARAHAAGHDDRLRRQPHLHARRVRRGGVRHRHLAGARRARLAVPGDRAAEGAAHPRHRHARRTASTPRTSSSTIIQRLGVRGGTGYAYEYAGDAIERMSMDERMTICNMSIEGGARVGYVNPDETTFEYLEGPAVRAAGRRVRRGRRRGGGRWRPIATPSYDDDVEMRAEELTPVVTWGVNPGQSIGVDGRVPSPDERRQRAAGGRPTRSTTWASRPGSRSPG